jgi:hypothetical protein
MLRPLIMVIRLVITRGVTDKRELTYKNTKLYYLHRFVLFQKLVVLRIKKILHSCFSL